ncbi:MAG: hypothetical protein HGA45_25275 [Chloroflexales bacterium]|nr:hypothetical protein [Chloroflexales bacterium]
MPRLRINLRELDEIDELDLIDELHELEERKGREEGGREEKDRRPLNPVALQRRQEQRKFGKDIARIMRERKSPKP